MKIKIIENPDKDVVFRIRRALTANEGFCPCRISRTPENKCICEDFRRKCSHGDTGECHCGLYIAKEDI